MNAGLLYWTLGIALTHFSGTSRAETQSPSGSRLRTEDFQNQTTDTVGSAMETLRGPDSQIERAQLQNLLKQLETLKKRNEQDQKYLQELEKEM